MNAHYCSKAHFYQEIIAKEELTDIPYPFKCPKGCQETFKKKYDLVRHMGVRHGLIQYFLQKETNGNGPEPPPSTSNSNASIQDISIDDDNKLDNNSMVTSVSSSETEDHEMAEEEFVSFSSKMILNLIIIFK